MENRERKQTIEKYFQSTFKQFLYELDVHSLTESDYKSILTKIEDKETGSSRPRALIAYYFAFYYLMQKFSTTTFCPLIIDSPNQQDQDVEHIDKIMQFINERQPKGSQMILGLAETYGVDFSGRIIELNHKYELLQKSEFESVNQEVRERLNQMWFGI